MRASNDVMNQSRCRADQPASVAGFTLIELMVVLVIIGILTAIAYPAYLRYVTNSRRAAAEACLSNYASYMERYYTTNLRYDQDSSGTKLTSLGSIGLDCASSQNTGAYYDYGFAKGYPTASAYELQATPQGVQKQRDTQCGMLTLDQTGQRGDNGTDTAGQCWAH